MLFAPIPKLKRDTTLVMKLKLKTLHTGRIVFLSFESVSITMIPADLFAESSKSITYTGVPL